MSTRMRLSDEEVDLVNKSRGTLVNVNENDQISNMYLDYLDERGIDPKDVVSCKHWQSASGEPRFSIVTRTEADAATEDDKIDMLEAMNDVISNHTISYPRKKKNRHDGEHLLVINPADVHIGKYAVECETGKGEAYDKEIAKQRVLEGVQGIIDKSRGFGIDRVLFCIGNDILHVDNVFNTTTSGTAQDQDGKWWQSFELALEVYVAAVEMLLDVAPVDCVHSMSNHDYQSGFHLAHALKSWFRNCKDVTVDAGVSHRKYYQYHNNMIGLEHGDGAKQADLPLLMAQENPQMWAACEHRTMFLHHLHHKIKLKFQSAKDYIGVTLEYMRSPSGADSWHARKGYKGAPKAVEGFIFHKDNGRVASLCHNF